MKLSRAGPDEIARELSFFPRWNENFLEPHRRPHKNWFYSVNEDVRKEENFMT